MPENPRTLVVGTTADYIDWIRNALPGQTIFLTDQSIRRLASEPQPGPEEEALCDLSNFDSTVDALTSHLKRWQIRVDGVACFDCESLDAAARLAGHFNLPYPSVKSIHSCRNKHLSKEIWRSDGVACPRARLADSAESLFRFLRETGGPCVVKPLTGSGSELVFRCETEEDCLRCFETVRKELGNRVGKRMYSSLNFAAFSVLAEECVSGPEYSCDFLMAGGHAKVLRLTRKIPFLSAPFGTTRAYIPAGYYPDEAPPLQNVKKAMERAALSLGIDMAICMADFIVRKGELVLLEMAPRPGGDCLPHLCLADSATDILALAVGFARSQSISMNGRMTIEECAGLRLFAKRNGTIKGIDTRKLRGDPRVRNVQIQAGEGRVVRMPPADYDSWLVGHAIFVPGPGAAISDQCEDLAGKLTIEMEET
jgi:biotin carboxylase